MLDFKPRTEIEIREEIQKKNKFLFSTRIQHNGHKIFEYNHSNGELSEMKIDFIKEIDLKGKVSSRGRVYIKKDCQYFQALNRKNCIKKLKKLGLTNIKQ
ncbi:hypothetical protein [Galbibacter sp. BG1]